MIEDFGGKEDVSVHSRRLASGACLNPTTHDRDSFDMSVSTGGNETYPGQNLSISQLLYAVRKKLQDACFAGRFVWA